MISVIICSKSNELISQLSKNIKGTIGIEFEFLIMENSTGEQSIFKAYNMGAKKAKYDTLCFIHEDVEFITMNWGKIIIDYLTNIETGLIGLAGSKFLSKYPAPWWLSIQNSTKIKNDGVLFYNLIHGPSNLIENNIIDRNPLTDWEDERVSVIDGVFMAVRKKVWVENKFDEDKFDGFHFYDLDFSTTVGMNYKNYVTSKILIKHFSKGNMGIEWLKSAVSFHKKWKSKLPIGSSTISTALLDKYENMAATEFCKLCVENKYYPQLFIKCWLVSVKDVNFSTAHLKLLLYYFKGLLFLFKENSLEALRFGKTKPSV